ncbi:MAG TPA: hypothetical protein VLM39_02775, partial [Ignavibacteriaceae bacterium]|nr:hypothetical protein [Ignavibacteriaceae bacterium]
MKTIYIFLCSILFFPVLFAQVPQTISYQGILTDISGNPKPDGDYSIKFSFYEAESGGDAVWSETKNLSVKKGLFSTSLGDLTPFNSNVKFDKQYWLGIKVGDEAELAPRIMLTSAGYSLMADNVANGKVVKSLNGLKDNITIEGGGGTTVTSNENKIKITSSTGGGSGILGIQNTNNTLDIDGPNGPTATINLKVPLTLTDSVTDFILTAANTANGHGIKGVSTGVGVYGESDDWYGVYGTAPAGTGVGGFSGTGTGITGQSVNGWGVYAFSQFGHAIHAGSVNDYGIVGNTTNGWGGVYGETVNRSHGILGYHNPGNNSGAGVYGYGASGIDWGDYAGWFEGSVYTSVHLYVGGNLSVSGDKNFKIDNPLDPANEYLLHSCVESSDRMNIYNGNITTDANGSATVELPGYFETLNIDYRYQLTVLGQFAQAIIESKIKSNRFTIRTDKPNVEVSWQVTGIRNDEYAKQHPFIAVQEKEVQNKGKYL